MRSRTFLFLILTFVLMVPSVIHSVTVTQTTAEQVAMNCYTERNEKNPTEFEIIETITEKENAENIFYIFNFDKTGFVIVSADDIAVPILGYVFEHNYTTENHPPQFDAMLASFREQIIYAKNNDLSPPQETVDKWNRLKVTTDMFVPENIRTVGPLLSTTWNQGQFYNESCPADAASVPSDPGTPGNGYVWAGCTATATAQVMKYHAHPVTGEGSHSYTDATYGPQSVNFGATTYTWATMPNNVTAVTPSVHTLLYHVGVGAEMGYGIYGSGAWIGGVHPATALSVLQNHFKYDLNSNYDQRNNYTLSVWNSMLKTELDNNRPLVYEGYNSGYSDGHAFVIDGYTGSSNDSYHVNFGWSGSYNGDYTLDAIAPSLPSYDYRFFQAALFGVEPRKWRPLPDVSIDVSQLAYTGVDLDSYCEVSAPSYSVATDLTGQEFALTINSNNELYFTASPSVTSNVNIDIIIRAAYTGGTADDTFNFIITGASSNYDWGDAPDPTYPTLSASTGAYHQIVAGVQLGNTIDSEPDGQPDATATGDDNDGNNDDDGVVFNSALIPGSTATVTVTASVPGILEGWIDFDGNGSWADSGEQIITNVSVPAGSTIHNLTVPVSSIIRSTYARFRFCTQGATLFFGQAPDGEVEDYLVDITTQGSSLKWEQPPDLTVNGMDVSCSNNPESNPPVVLADDFECTTTGPITDIHVWGSWWNDMQPEDMNTVVFRLSIHADIPAGGQPPWSMPGDVLWTRDFMFGEYDSELYNVGQEWWYDPFQMYFIPTGDNECWLYNFYIDEAEAFIQEGFPDFPIIYWLEVQAIFNDPNGIMFGWKTSETHWNDDAVWAQAVASFTGTWNELRYPPTHPYEDVSIDLAFRITTTPDEPPDEYDFGDAPEGQSSIAYPSTGVNGLFPTCITVGSASSYIQHGTGENLAWFGPMVDVEADGNAGLCSNCFPTYDDDECFQDGDAGLMIPDSYTIDATGSVIPCPNSTAGSSLGIICNTATWGVDIDIYVQNTSNADRLVNVLFDWNQNGYWLDDSTTTCSGMMIPEHVLINFVVPAGYIGPLSGLTPPSFVIGPNAGYFWSRFTISDLPVTAGQWDGSGVFEDGETEDYLLYVEDEEPDELDFGDAPDDTTGTLYPTLVINDGARHTINYQIYMGASIDSEIDGQPDAAATGDDNDGNDDEDGVTFYTLNIGQGANVDVTTSVAGYISAWIDFGIDNSWGEANDLIINNVYVAAGGTHTFAFNVPASLTVGTTFARFRFNTVGGLTYTGLADDGEVEDYQVDILEEITYEYDFGDAPEGNGALAYPSLGVVGNFPTCITIGTPNSYIKHGCANNAWFGPMVDWETDGNAGLCPGCFSTYDDDECYQDGDAGLIFPESYTIDSTNTVVPCQGSGGDSLGIVCNLAIWGIDIDIDVTNTLYDPAYVNVLFDWNQDGQWYNDSTTVCGNSVVQEHVLVDFEIPLNHIGALSVLNPPNFRIGPTHGNVWVRFSITDFEVGTNNWDGSGVFFEDGETEDYLLYVEDEIVDELDFGDAPDPAGAMMYPTTLANNGARHVIDYVTYLGAQIDAEPDGIQDPNALGDDNNNLPDEDGIVFKQIMTGSPAQVEVTTTAIGYLQGWMDFNADGDWNDAGEQIFTDAYINFAGTVCLNYYVPASATTGITFARFRFSTVGGIGIIGQAPDGEVEDYEVDIIEDPYVKWSQLPCEKLPGLHAHDYSITQYTQIILADDWLCNGGIVTDIHWWGNYEMNAGVELRGSGIDHFHISIHANDPTGSCLPLDPEIVGVDVLFNNITETNTGLVNLEGCPIYLYELILDNPYPQIEGNQYWLDINAICSDPTDPAYWRWQESSRSNNRILCGAVDKINPTPGIWNTILWSGAPGPNRYSDMAFEITSVEYVDELDFGDAPDPTYQTLLPNGANHIIDGVTFLGFSVDAEPDGQPNASATGDDIIGNDEDGVLFVSPLIPGEQGAVYVLANVPGFLNAWLDFDGNVSWDASEQIFTDEPLIMGWNPLNFTVPNSAAIGNTFARFRFSTVAGLGITGQADDGEVEDYRVLIEEDLHNGLKMHYHQWPDTTQFGVDVCVVEEIDLPRRIVADDFLCVESGPVNSIHIWGSWKYDEVIFDNLIFDLAIWSDNPGLPPDIWSEPETLLWERQLMPGEYNEFPYYYIANGECWYDPCTGDFLNPGDYTIWEYDFIIPDADAFFQEEGNVYWLSVKVYVPDSNFKFGWKSSVNHWNDDAVYQCNFPIDPWIEMIYPAGHPFNPINEEHVSMDMAFYIACHPANPVNFTITKVGTNMTLQWDPSWCAAYYNVYSSTDPYATFPGGWTLEPTGTHITTTTWNDPLPAGSKKFYRVTAEN